MSSVPPNMPPGRRCAASAIPPYDPKTQWRVYREQQKAAWRAQREAWRAQRYAAKAATRAPTARAFPPSSAPSSSSAWALWLCWCITGHIAAGDFWAWYGHWWPLLLIGAGLALLAEWALDTAPQDPRPPWRQLCRHHHPAGHPGRVRCRMEPLWGPVPRPVWRQRRRLLQLLRPARARQRPAGAQLADSRQLQPSTFRIPAATSASPPATAPTSRCRRTKWPMPTPTPMPKDLRRRSAACDRQRQRRAGQVGRQQQRAR